MIFRLFAAAALLTVTFASPSYARTDVKAACMNDIQRICAAEYKAHNRDAVRACLLAKLSETSETCQAAVHAEQAAKKPD